MGLMNILSNNNEGIDAKSAESKIRSEYPKLLGETETFELAFRCKGDTRDKNFLTSHRILIKCAKGLTNKRMNFVSIPYKSIKAFAVITAGASFMDRDTELKVWYDGGEETPLTIDFAKNAVNLFEVQQFFNHKVFHERSKTAGESPLTSTNAATGEFSNNKAYVKQTTNIESVFDWIGNDAVQLDPKSVQDRFGSGSQSPIFMPGEQVEIAYQARRDVLILTPIRFIVVDVKGWSGKKIEFFSLRWECVKAYSVETAGSFLDRDCDFVLHTSIPARRHIRQDLRQSKADIFQIQMAFSNKLLGGGTPNNTIPGIDQRKGHVDPGAAFFGGSNNRPLDATEVERIYRSNPSLLQEDESVEMAFRGRRDLVIFTTKRVIDVDVKGLSGKKVRIIMRVFSF